MEHVTALLLLVGCQGALDGCRELKAPEPLFETMTECRSALGPSMSKFTTRVPQVLATCIVVDPALQDDYDRLFWSVSADGLLHASLEVSGAVVAAAGSVQLTGQH